MPDYHVDLKAEARGLGFPGMDTPDGRRRASGHTRQHLTRGRNQPSMALRFTPIINPQDPGAR